MKFLMTVKDAIEYINKGAFGIFNISYKVLDVQKIKYEQHLAACERKRKECLEEARKNSLKRCRTISRSKERCATSAIWKHAGYRTSAKRKKSPIYNRRNWAGESPALNLIKHIN